MRKHEQFLGPTCRRLRLLLGRDKTVTKAVGSEAQWADTPGVASYQLPVAICQPAASDFSQATKRGIIRSSDPSVRGGIIRPVSHPCPESVLRGPSVLRPTQLATPNAQSRLAASQHQRVSCSI